MIYNLPVIEFMVVQDSLLIMKILPSSDRFQGLHPSFDRSQCIDIEAKVGLSKIARKKRYSQRKENANP